jgi:predicted amidohydrolase YtcJ
MQDGVMENYTAAMLEPYLIPSKSRGIPMVDPEKLKTAVTQLDASGFQVHFHAIGDAAIRSRWMQLRLRARRMATSGIATTSRTSS